MERIRRFAVVTTAIIIGAAAGILGWAVLGQRQLIYHPAEQVPPPAVAGVPDAEPLRIQAADGTNLRSWFVPAEGEPVGAVLVLHGNAGNRAHRGPLAAELSRRGLATLLLDYRGFGGSAGRPDEAGLLLDARAGADALRRHTRMPREQTIYFGESLGTAVAAQLAAERTPAAVVLRSPFPSLTAVGARAYPWLPVRTLLRDRFETLDAVTAYEGPVLAVAGSADTLVPPALSRQVVAAAPDATLLTVEGAGHNDRALLDGAEMLDGITAFLRGRAGIEVRGAPPA